MKADSSAPVSGESSAHSESREPAKRLRLHESNLRDSEQSGSAAKRSRKRSEASQLDSSNFRAAKRLLQCRLDSGLTQLEAAAIANESVHAIARRERNEVHLGALRLLMILERAAGVKVVK